MKVLATLLTPILLLLTACGSDDGAATASPSASASGSGSGSAASATTTPTRCQVEDGTDAEPTTRLRVTLDEWRIDPASAAVDAGNVEFDARNQGEEEHELVLVKGAAPEELTINGDGLDEAALPTGAAVVGEIEPFGPGQRCRATFELAAGGYSLVCNVVDKAEREAHAKEGMVTAFTVR